jgi:hypothetical protein
MQAVHQAFLGDVSKKKQVDYSRCDQRRNSGKDSNFDGRAFGKGVAGGGEAEHSPDESTTQNLQHRVSIAFEKVIQLAMEWEEHDCESHIAVLCQFD